MFEKKCKCLGAIFSHFFHFSVKKFRLRGVGRMADFFGACAVGSASGGAGCGRRGGATERAGGGQNLPRAAASGLRCLSAWLRPSRRACGRPHYKIVYIQKGAVSARGGGDSCGGGTEAGGRLSAPAARGQRVLVCAVARSDDGVRSQTKKAAQSLGRFRSALRHDMQTYSAAAG